MKLLNRVSAVLTGLLCLASLTAAQGLKVEFSPVFQGDTSGPVLVTMQNPGRPIAGQIRSSSYASTVLYPVELPTGSVKQVIVNQVGQGYNQQRLQFEAGARVIEAPSNYSYQQITHRAAVIHDEPDAVSQVTKAEPIKKLAAGLYGAKAESAPDRISGYDSFSSVWLGQGSDRLRDAQAAAIKHYLLQGGTVVFVGGASNSALRDPRWSDVLGETAQGLTNERESLLTGLPSLTFGSANLPSSVWNTSQFKNFGGYKSIGDGRAIILKFSPFDRVFVEAGATSRLVGRVITLAPRMDSFDHFYSSSNFQPSEEEYFPGYSNQTVSPTAQGAFKYEAPSATQLFAPVWIFALLLAPLAILIPRFLKKAEVAWILTPLAAVAVAAIVMSSQASLRNSVQAQVTTGTIFAHEGVDSSVAVLTTEVFFPRSGRFDLKLEPKERAEIKGGSSGFLAGSTSTFDVGAMILPPVTAKNLEFRTIATREVIEGVSDWIAYEVLPGKKLRVTNKSPYEIKSLQLGANKASASLARGKSLVLTSTVAQQDVSQLFCTFESLPLGPKVGTATSSIVMSYRLKRRPW